MQRSVLIQVAALVWVALLATALIAREAPLATVEGQVVAKETGRPIPGARVWAGGGKSELKWEWSRSVKADAQGRFRLEGVPAGPSYFSAAGKVHRTTQGDIPHDQFVLLHEGAENFVTLALEPVAPFLRLTMAQHVLTPDETPSITCHGYTRGDALWLTVRRFPFSALRHNGESPYTPYDEGLTIPAAVGEPVDAKTLPADPRDAEGALRRKLVLPSLPPGLYSVWVESRDAKSGTVFSVSEIGLVTKTAGRRVLGYVVDLKRGRPVPNAAITLFHGADAAAEGVTDAQGLYQTRLAQQPKEAGALVAQAGNSVAFTRTDRSYGEEEGSDEGGSDEEGGDEAVVNKGPLRVFLYTDRPIYRPGQVVHYKAIVRRRVGSHYRLPSGRSGRLEIHAPEGALLERRTVRVSATGSFYGDYQLAPEADIGRYSVQVSFGLGGGLGYGESGGSFDVAEYRKPEYLVTVAPRRKQYVRGDRADMSVSATYFWGGPVKAASVRYTVFREPYWGEFAEEGDPLAEYYAAEPMDHEAGEEVLSGKALTDDTGHLQIGFETASKETDSQDYVYRVEVEITEAGRMPVSASGTVTVSRGTFRLEVEPERSVASPGETVQVQIRAVNLDGKPRAGAPLEVTIRGKSERVTTDAGGRASVRVGERVQGGVEIRAAGTDERGNRVIGDGWVWIAQGAFSDPSYNYGDLEVIADKKRYLPGETAKLMIQSSHRGGAALVTVEGRELYHAEVVPLEAASTPVRVPIDAAYVPNVFVTVTLVHGKSYSRQQARLQISPEDHSLKVTVTPDGTRFGPRALVRYTIRTVDLHGRPVSAEASLGLVDESIYSIKPEPPFDSLETFYGFQENRVNTSFSFPEIYLAANAKDSGTSEVRREFPDTATWIPVLRTGADGRATVSVRLPDTLTTWRATVRAHTAATQVGTGIAKVVSTKPLLVRLEAPRFFTQNDETLIAAVVHNNTDRPQRVTVSLQAAGVSLLDGPRATLEVPPAGLARQDWRAAAGPGPEATLLVRAQASPTLSDAVELKKPIVAHGVEHRQGTSGEVTGTAAATTLTLPPGAIPAATTCRVTITASPAGIMLQALDYLHAADLDTAENAIGWFLPDMTVAMSLHELGVGGRGSGVGKGRRTDPRPPTPDPQSEIDRLFAELPQRVHDNLARLYRQQASEGGWSWAGSGQPDPFWTAYVLYGLDQARRGGYGVDADVMTRGIAALHRLLPRATDPGNRALALYVLARVERPVSAATREELLNMGVLARAGTSEPGSAGSVRVQEAGAAEGAPPSKRPLQNYARALVALGLADAGETAAAREVALTLNDSCKETALTATWPEIFPWGFYSCNDNETTGYAMMALIRLDPTNRRIAKAARWLMEKRTGDAWASTEDTASVIYALAAYMQHVARSKPADYVATVRVNGITAGERRVTRSNMFERLTLPIPANLLHTGDNTFTIEKAGTGTLLYSALLETRLAGENLPARSSGLIVTREYFQRERKRDIHGRWETRDIPLGGTVRVGDPIIVKLTARAPSPAREVILRDPLPAGCEGDTESGDTGGEEGYAPSGEAKVRDQTVVFTPGLLQKGLNHFEYRIYARIPGDYHVLPTQAACAYIPEIWGASPEIRLRIRE